jgi:hypothetical protein
LVFEEEREELLARAVEAVERFLSMVVVIGKGIVSLVSVWLRLLSDWRNRLVGDEVVRRAKEVIACGAGLWSVTC